MVPPRLRLAGRHIGPRGGSNAAQCSVFESGLKDHSHRRGGMRCAVTERGGRSTEHMPGAQHMRDEGTRTVTAGKAGTAMETTKLGAFAHVAGTALRIMLPIWLRWLRCC